MTASWLPHIEITGRRFGYARVSTQDQKLRMQLGSGHRPWANGTGKGYP